MKTLAYFFYFLFRPQFWVMSHEYSPRWDAFLNEAMDNADPKDLAIGSCILKVRGVCVWIENYPYAYGTPFDCGVIVRPSRRTILRLRDFVLAMSIEQAASK